MKSIYVLGLLMVSGLTLGGCDKGDSETETTTGPDLNEEDSTTSSTLLGDWEGTCEFSAYDMDIEIDIEEEHWDGDELEFEGDVTAEFYYYGYFFEIDGDMEGELEVDGDIEMKFDFGENGSMDIEGELEDPETIDGNCISGGVEADIELERD